VPDYLTDFLVATYTRLGLGLTILASMGFFGITALIAAFEHLAGRYLPSYARRNDVPFHKNHSTLADFLLLNPLIFAVVASVTVEMRRLPALLASKLGSTPAEAIALAQRYRALLSPGWLFPVLVVAVVGGWIYYLRRSFGATLRLRWPSESLMTEWYLAFATIVMMLVVAAFLWRVGVLGWYLSSVTKLGFARDTLLWSLGLDDIAEILGGVNGFLVLIILVFVGMSVHDFRLHRTTRPDRKVRVMIIGLIIVVTVTATVIPICSIHGHLIDTRSAWVEELLRSRSQAIGDAKSAFTKSIREISQLRDWPISTAGSLLTVVGQILLVAGSAVLQGMTENRAVRPVVVGDEEPRERA
jgi:hypothetical protein